MVEKNNPPKKGVKWLSSGIVLPLDRRATARGQEPVQTRALQAEFGAGRFYGGKEFEAGSSAVS